MKVEDRVKNIMQRKRRPVGETILDLPVETQLGLHRKFVKSVIRNLFYTYGLTSIKRCSNCGEIILSKSSINEDHFVGCNKCEKIQLVLDVTGEIDHES